MDRSDEKKDASDVEPRPGGALGLGGSAAPTTPGEPVPSNDSASMERERKRVREHDEKDLKEG